MSIIPALKYVSVEEYLEMEEASLEKHEYYGGEVFAMAGAGFPHNQIVANAFGNIYQFLKDKDCRVYGSDLKVHVKNKSSFVYPDLSMICNGPGFYQDKKDIITNPSVIIEVLSLKTQDFDHGQKFMLYRQIASLKEYILISSMEILFERFVKNQAGDWTLSEFKNADDMVVIDSINYQTRLKEFYRDVDFDLEAKVSKE